MDIKIPNLGDGIESATVLNILVQVGDQINKNDTIMELETDKAVAPVPATSAGKIMQVLVKPGDSVATGKVIVKLESNNNQSIQKEPKTEVPVPKPEANIPEQKAESKVTDSAIQTFQYQALSGAPVPTSPSIRKHAYQFGIDLQRIKGTGKGGRVLLEDVRNYILFLQSQSFQSQASLVETDTMPKPEKPSIDFSKFGSVKKEKLTGLRKKIAEKMTQSWEAPHVTQFGEIEITHMMKLRKKYKEQYEKKGAGLTVTIILIKVLIDLLKKYPIFNASIDENNNELVYKHYYHIGVAVDTKAGLIVPVVKNCDQKSILDIALEVNQLAEKARKRTLAVEDLQGGSFTVSNLGSLGVGSFTPIINTPEVAILGLGRGKNVPVIREKKIETGMVMPISLSYDHRVIDGADGARFVFEYIEKVESIKESFFKL